MTRLANLTLAALLLGPISGPLAFGCASCLRAKRYAMAAVYVLGVTEAVIGLPWVAVKLAGAVT